MANQEPNQNSQNYQGQVPQQQKPAQQSGYVSHGQLEAAKHMAEQQLDQAIDQFAQKIPGGAEYTQQAKDAAASILTSYYVHLSLMDRYDSTLTGPTYCLRHQSISCQMGFAAHPPCCHGFGRMGRTAPQFLGGQVYSSYVILYVALDER